MKNAVSFETNRLSANLSSTALANTSFTANINVNGNVNMNAEKVGTLTAPAVAKTFRRGGAYVH